MARALKTPAEVDVESMLAGVADDLNHLPVPVMRDILPVIREAEMVVANDLRKALATVDGAERFTAQQYRRVLIQLQMARKQLGANLSRWPGWLIRIKDRVGEALGVGGRAAGRLAGVHLQAQFAYYAQAFPGTIQALDVNTIALVTRGEKMLIPRFKSSALRYAGGIADDIKRNLAVGVARGETFHEMTNRLMRLGGHKGAVPEGMAARAEGMSHTVFGRARYRAERVVRTEMINAYNAQAHDGIMQAHKEDEGIIRRWDASADARLCPICRDLDGRVAGITEEFPGGIMYPPAHPNCRCSVVAWHKDW